jgi:hypothetical protein
MSAVSGLQGIINETKAAFVVAKFDGKLEATEVVQIATTLAMKIYALSNCSLDEKKALVVFALKKGLEAAGGLHGLTDLSGSGPAGLAAAEKQVLDAALAAVDVLLGAAPKLFAPVQNFLSSLRESLSTCLPFCSQVAALAATLDPKDSAVIVQALKGVGVEVPAALGSTLESVVSNLETVLPIVQNVKGVLHENIVETEPSLEASPPEVHELLPAVPGQPN